MTGLLLGLLGVATAAPGAPGTTATIPAWPQFRGPHGNAVAEDGPPPDHFGPGTNVVWQVAVPPGHSSPCIWDSRLFLTAVREGRLLTLAFDRRTGQELWRREVQPSHVEPTHRIGSPAAPTPCTDGTAVFAYFGSFGVVAYRFDGTELWRRPLPPPMVEFGTGTSPILAGPRLILVSDGDEGSHLQAFDPATGRTLWRTERPEFRRSFATPYLWRHEAGEELVVPGSIWLRSYDPGTGRELWSYTGTSRVANSSPAAGHGLLFSASWNIGADPGDRVTLEPHASFAKQNDANQDGLLAREEIPAGPVRERFTQMDLNKDGRVTQGEWDLMREMFAKAGNALLALRPGGRGDVTTSHLAWKATRSLPYVCSPVLLDDGLYTVKNGGLVSCYDARTGQPHYQDERLDAPGDYYASLIAGRGRVIAISQRGRATVIAAGRRLEVIARHDLGAEVMATPALVEGTLYVRTATHLWAFRSPAGR